MEIIPFDKRIGFIWYNGKFVEWQNANQLPGHIFGISYWNVMIANSYLNKISDGIISISEYLYKYYIKCGCKSQLIPYLSRENLLRFYKSSKIKNQLKLIYAGDPGKNGQKDLLMPLIYAINKKYNNKIQLDIYVTTLERINSISKKKLKLCKNIIVHGRVPKEIILNKMKTADFSVLLRNNLRFSNAGFPSKFVESFSNSVPLFANITSDLGRYINKSNSIIVGKINEEEIIQCLEIALKLSNEEHNIMKKECLKVVKNKLNYNLYSSRIKKLI